MNREGAVIIVHQHGSQAIFLIIYLSIYSSRCYTSPSVFLLLSGNLARSIPKRNGVHVCLANAHDPEPLPA